MTEQETKQEGVAGGPTADLRNMIREVIQEFTQVEQAKSEPAYKVELDEERKRREQLERRLNELVQENKRTRQAAEELERSSKIRTELQRLGVSKIDLAYRAVKDDVQRSEDGRLVVRTEQGETPLPEYLSNFVSENPELLPARNVSGSGAGFVERQHAGSREGVDIDKIRPGMSTEELARVRQEIARIATQGVLGY
jgi:hypothetical protein